ncbi:MAG TPA: phosphoglycolate phosphatase [Luteimonas sp.]|nr:phosphoglycolate phosphatase [Luteimonas sp.]
MPADGHAAGGIPPLVLFDLDGTLLDSAPDFVATLRVLRSRHGMPPISEAQLRPHVSKGARAMLRAAFPDLDEAAREALVQPFLDVYRAELGRHGGPFDGVETLLRAIEDGGARWGIVTNKPEALARALMPILGWEARCAVLVGGDTLPVAKPDPRPLLHAARAQSLGPGECVYVGDDERDIIAARAAGMPALVALWGYRLDEDDPLAWQADALFEAPRDLLAHWV